jgi:hopanoid biosynthesis associated protein HpnK
MICPPIRLIVNADDFGRSESVNEAVATAYDRGILTSCSLMVAEEAAASAVEAARERPGLAVGLHVVVVNGHAASARASIDRLVDAAGCFPNDPVRAGLYYTFDRVARSQLERELRAQFERFAETGLPLSHVDGHLHMHMHPFVFDRVVGLAKEFGSPRIRIPRDDWWGALRADGTRMLAQGPLAAIFALLCRRARKRLAGRGLAFTDRVYGLFRTDRMNEEALLDLLQRMPPGDHEVYSHPDAGGRGAAGEAELAALVSPAVRRVVDARGIQRVAYRDLECLRCP